MECFAFLQPSSALKHFLISLSIPSSWGVQAICSLRLEEQSDPEPHQGPIQPRDNLRAVSRQSVRTGTERQHLCLGRRGFLFLVLPSSWVYKWCWLYLHLMYRDAKRFAQMLAFASISSFWGRAVWAFGKGWGFATDCKAFVSFLLIVNNWL